MDNSQKKLIKFSIIAFVLFIAFLILNPLYIVTSGSKGLSFRFGAIQNKEIAPGLHMRVPLVESIKTVSIQPSKLEYDVEVGSDGAITKDNQTIGASTTTFYKFKEGQLVNMWQSYGTKNIENLVITSVKNAVKSSMGNYTIFDIASNQTKIKAEVLKATRESLVNYPVEITELNITNFDWSDDFDKQIKDTMSKKQQVLAKEQEVLIAKAEADKLVNQAEAEKKASVAKAEAEKQVAITQAEGEKESAKLRADAKALEGEGIKKYNESIAANLDVQLKLKQLDIEQARVDKWNGAYVSNNNYMPIPYNYGVAQGK